MAVSNQLLFVYSNGKKIKNSNALEILYKSVSVTSDGNDNGFTITQGATGFDFAGKKLVNLASGTASGQALVYDQRGANNGVASLDTAGKIPASELPNSVMEYKGTFDASGAGIPNLQNTGAAIKASKVIQGLTYTADTAGANGNSISLTYVDPAAPSQALSVAVVGSAITVNLATDSSSVITSTANDVSTAVSGYPAAAALVDVSGSGASPLTAQALTLLVGGADAATAGDVYKVSVAGSHNFGAGAIDFVVGDYAIYNGTAWEKSHSGADAVISVNGQAGVVVLSTDNVAEGTTNLYYTDARVDTEFDTRLALKTTDNLSEGTTNLYYTDARVDTEFDTRLALKTTDNLTEGTTNLYFSGKTTDGLSEGTTNLYFSGKTTDALSEGTVNLYYTDARVDTEFDTRLALKTTDNLTEGTTNLYFSGKTTDGLSEGTTNLYFSGKTTDGLSEGTTNLYFSGKTTDGLSEGTVNLYYTDARVDTEFDTRLALKTTDNLTEGTTNLYFSGKTTDGLSEGTTNLYFSGKTTDDLAEGTVNIYFTDGRAQTAVVASSIVDGDTTHAPSGEAVYEAFAALGTSASYKSYTNMEASPITIRQFVYQSAAGQVLLLRADAALANDYVVFGSVKDTSIAASASGNVFLPQMGVRIGGFTGLDVTKPVYASRLTAGSYIQSLAGFVAGEYAILLGYPISATEIIFIGQVEFQF